MLMARKEANRLLKKIRKANRQRKSAADYLDFVLVVKRPPGARELLQIITGKVPASFRFSVNECGILS